MPRYMMFITHSEDYRNYPIPKALHDEMGHFANENLESGVLIDASGFEPTSAAKCVRLSRGKLTVTDGPFAEAKEVIGGYALVETHSSDEAIDFATTVMDIHRRHWPEFEGACEVRPIDGEKSTASASPPHPKCVPDLSLTGKHPPRGHRLAR
jgi:hypothetical protein